MAVSDTRDYVLAFESNKNEAVQIAKATADKLQTKQVTLIEVVQSLGEYINDDDEKIRARAINYLTAIISSLDSKYLSRQQIQVLNQFLCDRIEDGGAIEGLSKLQELDRFTNDMTQMLVRAIFEHFTDLQSRTQSARFKVLSLMNDLLNKHRKAVRDMGDTSLVGVVGLVAGEKDPRNLMLVFSMLRVFMVEWDTTKHIDILFDAVYAYFPITFRPPPNDPYGITAQDLKDRLRDCLASTGSLAPQTFPNLLDRLDSTSDVVKKDVLQALAACALKYGFQTISQYSITLWDAVKFEVLQAQEPFLADEALVVIKNVAICLSKGPGEIPASDVLLQYLKPINKECIEHLQEPSSRQAKASGDILKAAASASVRSFEIVMKSVGPALFTLQQSSDGIVNQRAILTVTNQLFEAAVEVYGSWTVPVAKNHDGRENLLVEFKDKLVAIYSQALMGTVKEEVSFRLTAAKGLLLLSQMRSLLAENEVGLFVQYFNDIVIKEESYGRDELKQRAMTALAEISKFKPRLITDITFPAFIARLPDTEEQAASTKEYPAVLEGLAEISIGRELLETLMRRLLNKVDVLFQSEPQADYPYTSAILSTINYVLRRSTNDGIVTLDTYFDRIVVGMSKKAVMSSAGPLANEVVLDLLGRIVNLIIRNSNQDHINMAAENVYLLFREPQTVKQNEGPIVTEPRLALLLSTWVLAALPRHVTTGVLGKSQILTILNELSGFAATCGNQAVQISGLRQVALLVNKHLAPSDLQVVEEALARTRQSLTDSQTYEYSIRLLFTLSKALVLRLAPKTNQYLSDLVSLLDSTKYTEVQSRFAAAGFGTILATDDVVSKENYAQIRLLAPQRVFQTLVPMFSAIFRGSNSSFSEKETYLIALSGILGTVPSEIVMPELPTLLPLLLQSLDISDQMVKVATLETLAIVITNNPAALEESGHISALVKRLISSAAIPKQKGGKVALVTSTPHTRRLATRCLTLLPKHVVTKTPNPLLSLKREVLQGLLAVLDDPKRDVRKEGVDARAAWIRGVDDVNDDDDD